MKNKGNILLGIILLAIGIVLGLNALGITHIDISSIFFRGWWTLIIIIPGLISIAKHPTKMWPYVVTAIGFILLLMARGFISFGFIFKMIIPVTLVVIGLKLIFGKVIKNETQKCETGKMSSLKGKNVIFGEKTYNLSNAEFLGDSLECSFGHMRYFMQESTLRENQILNVDVTFGKVDIFVPKDVNIVVRGDVTLGVVNNKSMNDIEKGRPILTIKASCAFGGINII